MKIDVRFVSVLMLAFPVYLIISSCSKPGTVGGNTDQDFTPVPPAGETINTSLTVYLLPDPDADPTTDQGDVSIQGMSTQKEYAAYTKNDFSTDPFSTVISGVRQSLNRKFFRTARVLPVSPSNKNFADARVVYVNHYDFIYKDNPTSWELSGGAKLTAPSNSFINSVSTQASTFEDSYLDPAKPDFATTLPCFFADFDDRRWFLKSYGAIIIDYDKVWTIKPGADVNLFLPMPAAMTAGAPDSVIAWLFKDNKWIDKGYAQKTGNGYSKKIDEKGVWNFAEPVNGVYLAVKMQTTKSSPVINAPVVIKSGNNEIATARTDITGTAICFVPTNENLELEVLGTTTYNTGSFKQVIPALKSAGEIAVNLPVDSRWLYSLSGKAFDCSGNSLQNGTLFVKTNKGHPYSQMDIVNGNYNGAFIVNGDMVEYYPSADFVFTTANHLNPSEIGDTLFLPKAGELQSVNFNSCSENKNVFMNYTVDGAAYEINGTVSAPTIPFVHASYFSDITTIDAIDNPAGRSVEVRITVTPGVASYSAAYIKITDLWLNGSHYFVEKFKPATLTFTRFDHIAQSYVEGSMDFYYLDAGNASHRFTAVFRAYRYL